MLERLRTFLQANAGVQHELGERLYPQRGPQRAGAETPYATYQVSSSLPTRHLKGDSGLDFTLVEITVHGRSYEEADLAADAIRGAIGRDGFAGDWGGTRVQLAYWSNWSGEYTPPWLADAEGMHEITLDLEIRHEP